MSAIVCGKRSFFEELTVTSPPVSKRIRCSSSSPVRFSPPRSNTLVSNPASFNFSSSSSSSSTFVEQLAAIFPDMDKQLLEKALEECGDDLDSAIRSLNELRLASVENFSAAAVKSDVMGKANVPPQETSIDGFIKCYQFKVTWRTLDALIVLNCYPEIMEQGLAPTDAEAPTEDPSASALLSMDGMEWVELFVREMVSASNIDDARARASRALEALEKSICTRAGAEAAKSVHQENMMLKEQMQALIQENSILKRAVSIQHERQKEFEESSQELQQLKQLVSQYQDQLRTLEVNNYALTLHLKQAQQSSSIPGRFHPDVF
ncbi:hypothetical protein NC653_015844 [Populus alba x Populus x berolinensis]|uniref:CUE domain-containing protein n=1 Tax=Populus alba x Populus x berolinensis TaxID=444605 RepID=A0AAD6QLE4_9ROSI|nr:hypothetical protein NC653_015844 [Populus alba x Populus x berolinensis]